MNRKYRHEIKKKQVKHWIEVKQYKIQLQKEKRYMRKYKR